jgi:hypothetical protein
LFALLGELSVRSVPSGSVIAQSGDAKLPMNTVALSSAALSLNIVLIVLIFGSQKYTRPKNRHYQCGQNARADTDFVGRTVSLQNHV